ncbi:TBC domain containing protein [Entamoeba histolytica KU27]|uniref:TBC domain containing protein n=1 Tax=Entamoeba histolytica KU27 TaxID=885311 RepID=M2RRC2_ENTHI|nr:TBC domain containing protein [Entamoeba histolytica KU27]
MEKDKWKELFSKDIIDIDKMKKLIYKEGVPNDSVIRMKVWKLLLGYYTPRKREWEEIDYNCLEQYEKYIKNIYPKYPSTLLDKTWNEIWKTTENCIDIYPIETSSFELNEIELKRIQLIEKDIIRTVIGAPINRDEPIRHDLGFRRILFILSLTNGGVSYVQGMNNLCNVFYSLFASSSNQPDYRLVESQTFGCMFLLIDLMRNWFLSSNDNLPNGINASMKQVDCLLQQTDNKLYNQFTSNGIESSLYMFRWLTLLCCMEFTLFETFMYWDFFFIDLDEFVLLKVVCCSIILCLKKVLINKDFSSTLKILQNIPSISHSKVIKKSKKILKTILHFKIHHYTSQFPFNAFMHIKTSSSHVNYSLNNPLISLNNENALSPSQCKQVDTYVHLSSSPSQCTNSLLLEKKSSDLSQINRKHSIDQSKRKVIHLKTIK